MKPLSLQCMIVLLLLIACTCSRANQAGDVCGAKNSPSKFAGHDVIIRGKIVSDGMHTTIVVPDKCPNEGYPFVLGKKDGDAAAIVRQAIMRIGSPGTVDKDITVEVDASVTLLETGVVGVRVTKLRRMVLTYPSGG
jgi:hypothetical protein